MDRANALRKIQKCLDLSKSPEPHEAARAMRHAQTLMEKFQVDHPELMASGVLEASGESRARRYPPSYEVDLANAVARSFGCKILFSVGCSISKINGSYRFIGVGAAADVAGYTFSVLTRKLAFARAEYTKAKLGKYKKNKVAAADEFCGGWVAAVARGISDTSFDGGREASLLSYMSRSYSNLVCATPRRRSLTNEGRAFDHRFNGFSEGRGARVNVGIESNGANQKLLGSS